MKNNSKKIVKKAKTSKKVAKKATKAKPSKKVTKKATKAKTSKKVAKKATKAKTSKKVAKKATKASKKTVVDFDSWWEISKSQDKINKFVKQWIKQNPPNPEDEDCGGDFWHVNQMVHEGEADYLCRENSKEVFDRVLEKGESGRPTQCDSLYCNLDDIIWESYEVALDLFITNNKK